MRQPWIHSSAVDGIFILGIPYFIVAIALIFRPHFALPDSMTVVSWAILVLGIDVSHVYSTLYRTYLDRKTRARHSVMLYVVPFAVFIACMALYAMGAMTFWRVMAYLAVFHFARQQYGFMRVYSRDEPRPRWQNHVDTLTIYAATIYPIIAWHLSGQKNFNWFMKGDFMYVHANFAIEGVLHASYVAILIAYVLKEIFYCWASRVFNWPRNLLVLGTVISWYTGIIYFNSDLAFTAINTAAHGIPYIALVWIWGNKRAQKAESFNSNFFTIFRPRYFVFFLASLLFFGYLEEGFWSAWVWQDSEHRGFFVLFHQLLGDLDVNSPWLKIIVPLLSVPQITHYIIDGFIWKIRKDKFAWRDITLSSTR